MPSIGFLPRPQAHCWPVLVVNPSAGHQDRRYIGFQLVYCSSALTLNKPTVFWSRPSFLRSHNFLLRLQLLKSKNHYHPVPILAFHLSTTRLSHSSLYYYDIKSIVIVVVHTARQLLKYSKSSPVFGSISFVFPCPSFLPPLARPERSLKPSCLLQSPLPCRCQATPLLASLKTWFLPEALLHFHSPHHKRLQSHHDPGSTACPPAWLPGSASDWPHLTHLTSQLPTPRRLTALEPNHQRDFLSVSHHRQPPTTNFLPQLQSIGQGKYQDIPISRLTTSPISSLLHYHHHCFATSALAKSNVIAISDHKVS